MAPHDDLLGQLLMDSGALTAVALEGARKEQRRSGRGLGDVLLRNGLVGETQMARVLAAHLDLGFVAPPFQPEAQALGKIDAAVARPRCVLPLTLEGRLLTVAVADPLDAGLIDDLSFRSECHVEAVVAPPSALAEAVLKNYGEELPELLDRLGPAPASRVRGEARDLEEEATAPRSSESWTTSSPTPSTVEPATSISRPCAKARVSGCALTAH